MVLYNPYTKQTLPSPPKRPRLNDLDKGEHDNEDDTSSYSNGRAQNIVPTTAAHSIVTSSAVSLSNSVLPRQLTFASTTFASSFSSNVLSKANHSIGIKDTETGDSSAESTTATQSASSDVSPLLQPSATPAIAENLTSKLHSASPKPVSNTRNPYLKTNTSITSSTATSNPYSRSNTAPKNSSFSSKTISKPTIQQFPRGVTQRNLSSNPYYNSSPNNPNNTSANNSISSHLNRRCGDDTANNPKSMEAAPIPQSSPSVANTTSDHHSQLARSTLPESTKTDNMPSALTSKHQTTRITSSSQSSSQKDNLVSSPVIADKINQPNTIDGTFSSISNQSKPKKCVINPYLKANEKQSSSINRSNTPDTRPLPRTNNIFSQDYPAENILKSTHLNRTSKIGTPSHDNTKSINRNDSLTQFHPAMTETTTTPCTWTQLSESTSSSRSTSPFLEEKNIIVNESIDPSIEPGKYTFKAAPSHQFATAKHSSYIHGNQKHGHNTSDQSDRRNSSKTSPVMDKSIPSEKNLSLKHPQKVNQSFSVSQNAEAGTASTMPPKEGNVTASSRYSNSAVASIRPPSWKTKLPTTNNTSPQQNPPASQSGLELPGEIPLPRQLQYDPDTMKPISDEYRKPLVENAKLSSPLLNGWTLYAHQRRAIVQALVRRRMILALDMGLGKTLIGCVWARAFKATFERLKVLVICPVSLKEEWKRTAENATGLVVEENGSKSDTPADSLDLRICSWSKVPTEVDDRIDNYVVIFDEAHSIQSMEASRTKSSLKLVHSNRCVGVLLLTGTPMKNGKASNLFPLLKAVRHPLGKHQKAYEAHFCAGVEKFMKGRKVWDASGCSNLNQLKRLVAPSLLYLTKEQCLAELPPLTRETRRIPISSRCQLRYVKAVKELAHIDYKSHSGNLREDQQEAVLGAIQRLRVLCSFAKVGAAVELAKCILEAEPAVVIFSSFAEVAKSVHEQLENSGWDGELLTGQTPQKKRQAMVDRFQEGLSSVFVCTFGAGGVGLTLTAACTVILIDRPWTPGETRQAEDRIRRIGQTQPVKSIWLSAFDLDVQMDAMVDSKLQASNAVLAKEETDGFAGDIAKISATKLAASLLRTTVNDVIHS